MRDGHISKIHQSVPKQKREALRGPPSTAVGSSQKRQWPLPLILSREMFNL